MNICSKINDQVVDQTELRVHQFFTIIVFLTAFVLGRWELVALQSLIFALTFMNPRFSPYIALYHYVLRPSGLIRPDLRLDNTAPHRFATMIGLLVSSSAAYLLATGVYWLGFSVADSRSGRHCIFRLVRRVFYVLHAQSTRPERFL